VLLASVAMLATPSRARAQAQLELSWDAPAGCPQAGAVRQKLQSIAGETLANAEQLRADGRITRSDGRYRLTLTVGEGRTARSRTIDADVCSDLAGAAAVALGLLLREAAGTADGTVTPTPDGTSTTNPNGEANRTTGEKTNPDGAKAAGAATTKKAANPNDSNAEDRKDESDSNSETGSSSPRNWRILLRAPIGTVDVGPLPKPTVSVGGGLGVRVGAWRAGASGRIFSDQTLWDSDTPNVGVRVSRVMLEVWTCRGFRSGAAELAPCVTLGVEHLTARGTGADVQPQSTRVNSVVPGAAAWGYLYLAEWLALTATAGLGVETTRTQFVVGSLGKAQQVGPILFSLGLGTEWIF
jgi:hypothetical protein